MNINKSKCIKTLLETSDCIGARISTENLKRSMTDYFNDRSVYFN